MLKGIEGSETYKLRQIPKEDLTPKYGQGQQEVGRLQDRWRAGRLQERRNPGSHLLLRREEVHTVHLGGA